MKVDRANINEQTFFERQSWPVASCAVVDRCYNTYTQPSHIIQVEDSDPSPVLYHGGPFLYPSIYIYIIETIQPRTSPHGQPKQTNLLFFSQGGGGLAARPQLHFYPFPGVAPSVSFIKLFPARGAVLLGRVRFCRSTSCPPVPFESFMGGRGGRPPPPTLPLPAGVSPPGPLIVYRLLGGNMPITPLRKCLQTLAPNRPPLVDDGAQGAGTVSDNAALC